MTKDCPIHPLLTEPAVKACPFCSTTSYFKRGPFIADNRWSAGCGVCNIWTEYFLSQETASNYWNRRTSPEAEALGKIEALIPKDLLDLDMDDCLPLVYGIKAIVDQARTP
jgi:hypothetical protein